jgi:hypothetical protein
MAPRNDKYKQALLNRFAVEQSAVDSGYRPVAIADLRKISRALHHLLKCNAQLKQTVDALPTYYTTRYVEHVTRLNKSIQKKRSTIASLRAQLSAMHRAAPRVVWAARADTVIYLLAGTRVSVQEQIKTLPRRARVFARKRCSNPSLECSALIRMACSQHPHVSHIGKRKIVFVDVKSADAYQVRAKQMLQRAPDDDTKVLNFDNANETSTDQDSDDDEDDDHDDDEDIDYGSAAARFAPADECADRLARQSLH